MDSTFVSTCADCVVAQLPQTEVLEYQLMVFHAAGHPFKRLAILAEAAMATWNAGYRAGIAA
jgi:hypothetical protein